MVSVESDEPYTIEKESLGAIECNQHWDEQYESQLVWQGSGATTREACDEARERAETNDKAACEKWLEEQKKSCPRPCQFNGKCEGVSTFRIRVRQGHPYPAPVGQAYCQAKVKGKASCKK